MLDAVAQTEEPPSKEQLLSWFGNMPQAYSMLAQLLAEGRITRIEGGKLVRSDGVNPDEVRDNNKKS